MKPFNTHLVSRCPNAISLEPIAPIKLDLWGSHHVYNRKRYKKLHQLLAWTLRAILFCEKKESPEADLASVQDEINKIIAENPNRNWFEGDCFMMYRLLKEKFPDAEPYYDGVEGHVYTMIYGRLWDANGLFLYPMKQEPRIFEEAFEWTSQK